MEAVALGPFVLAGERIAVIVAIGVFGVAAALLRRLDPGVDRWASYALLAGLLGARLGHIAEHYDNFIHEPHRILLIWQGGFSPLWGTIAVACASLLLISRPKEALAPILAISAGVAAWISVHQALPIITLKDLPAVALQRMDGGALTLPEFKGAPIVVNLWASWCPPCRREMPLLAEMARSTKDVRFVFVNQGEQEEKVAAYLGAAQLNLPHVLIDKGSAVAAHYEAVGLPATLFIGADGRLKTTHFGEISREALADNLAKLR